MESIFTITTIDDRLYPKGDSRCVGYRLELGDAQESVINNYGDIHEDSYNYCAIEEVIPGIYPYVIKEYWYMWSKVANEYVSIEKPNRYMTTCNFSIG